MEELVVLDVPLEAQGSIDLDRIKADDEIAKAPYVLLIDGVGKMSKGNISSWKGIAKSKKTFALTLIMANLVGKASLHEKFSPANKGLVAWVDTEQSPYDAQKIVKRIKTMCGNEDDLMFYALRKYGAKDRVSKVESLLTKHGEKIDVLVIDGVRDLVNDFNDATESSKLISKLMAWSIDYDCHISVVLHANKSDGNMRGHLGTELENKSETVFSVTKDQNIKDVSLVEEQFGRGKEIESFEIKINKNGLPEVVDGKIHLDDDDSPF